MGSVEEEDKGSESQSEVWTNVCVRKNKSVQNESEKKKKPTTKDTQHEVLRPKHCIVRRLKKKKVA